MTRSKRAFDLCLTALIGGPVALGIACLAVWLWICQGRPIFFGAERMGQNGRPFHLWKFRTMAGADDGRATGGDKRDRITQAGHWLRRYRLDELPQLWNILRGDLSFVGPRPPLRRYVQARPDLYAQVLQSRPGLTGLATLFYHRREAELLKACQDGAETDRLYREVCVPRKAALDLIYQRRASRALDLALVFRTLAGVIRG